MKVILLILCAIIATATELTSKTWDDAVRGKSVFVHFHTPWCKLCRNMRPDWTEVVDHWGEPTFDPNNPKYGENILIADVDCENGGEELCKRLGIDEFPTLMYGDPENLKEYDGSLTETALIQFSERSVDPTCRPDLLDLCTEEEKQLIAKFEKINVDELDVEIEELRFKTEAIEDEHKDKIEDIDYEVEGLDKQILVLQDENHVNLVKEKRKHSYKYLKQVQAFKQKKSKNMPRQNAEL